MSKARTIKLGSMTLTEDEARKAGVLPEQRRERMQRQLATLVGLGLSRTQEASGLSVAIRRGSK